MIMDDLRLKKVWGLKNLLWMLCQRPSKLSCTVLTPVLCSCRYLASLRGHVQRVYQVAWSADSRLLCSGSADSTLKVWDIKARRLLNDLPGHADEVCYMWNCVDPFCAEFL